MYIEDRARELDLHGMTCCQARGVIDAALRQAGKDTCRLQLIHGYRGGTDLKAMIRKTYGKHPRVLRLEVGLNPGATDLVLREK